MLTLALFLLVSGCATSGPGQQPATDKTVGANSPSDSNGISDSKNDETHYNTDAIAHLWQVRTADASRPGASREFVLGPGDVLQISIPQIPQVGNRIERVSEQDTISLPMLGEISVAGMTQEDLLRTLAQRVGKFVYHPQVDVFIQHAEAREVSVIGSVKNPGRYMLTSKSETIMTMIGHAGGMSENAGSRIILLPGGTSAGPTSVAEDAHSTGVAPGGSAKPDYSATGSTAVAYDGAVPRPADVDGGTNSGPTVAETLRRRIVISTTSAEDQRYLELPAKPGDVILIPAAGEVTVQGWVDKPGAFPVTPGMTVLSSIAAAGGSLFSNYATLLREQYGGRKLDLSLDLTRLKNGTEQDVQVQSGDVIVVERSMAGAVPYSLYFLVQKVGIGLPLIPAF